MGQNCCTKTTTTSSTMPIKASTCDVDNPVKSNVALKYAVAAVSAGIGLWLAGYFFTRGAIAAGGK